jgi:hypothetical protein
MSRLRSLASTGIVVNMGQEGKSTWGCWAHGEENVLNEMEH